VNAIAPGGELEVVAEVPMQPSGLGFLPDGNLLIVSMLDRKLLRQQPDMTLVLKQARLNRAWATSQFFEHAKLSSAS
jgi:hypothetical protein